MKLFTAFSIAALASSVYGFGAVVNPNGPFPKTTEKGQYGYNNCGTKDSPTSKCQNLWINNAEDFCLYGPPQKNSLVGDTERVQVAWCTKPKHGARLIPAGTFTGVHFIRTPNYIQITGVGDFTKMNIKKGDDGGELDPHGADGNGNPIGALVFGTDNSGTKIQFTEWTEFIAAYEFCIRACFPGPDASRWCQHIYDLQGCYWNEPGNYNKGFDTCAADSVSLPMGVYSKSGSLSTWYQGVNPTPAPHAAGKTSKCKSITRPDGAKYASAAKRSVVAMIDN